MSNSDAPNEARHIDAALVLVAEDDKDNREIAVSILRGAGYRVIEAANGADALQLARRDQPALILMDVLMPDVDGWTAAEELKADAATRDIVVIAFTAHSVLGMSDIARHVGCAGFIVKPVSPARLIREVRDALADAPLRAVNYTRLS